MLTEESIKKGAKVFSHWSCATPEATKDFETEFVKYVLWVQKEATDKPPLSKRIGRILDRIFLVLSWLGTLALWLLVFALFAMLLTKGSMTVTLVYGK